MPTLKQSEILDKAINALDECIKKVESMGNKTEKHDHDLKTAKVYKWLFKSMKNYSFCPCCMEKWDSKTKRQVKALVKLAENTCPCFVERFEYMVPGVEYLFRLVIGLLPDGE